MEQSLLVLCAPGCHGGAVQERLLAVLGNGARHGLSVQEVAGRQELCAAVRSSRGRQPGMKIFAFISNECADLVLELHSLGLDDFILWPARDEELNLRLRRCLVVSSAKEHASRPPSKGDVRIVYEHPQMETLVGEVRELANFEVPVHIVGETGVGKELIARALHAWGPRSGGPFVPVNCGAIPESLFESECFGHEAGSFTGAVVRRKGLFGQAVGGTLFLDEVDTLGLSTQAKLLRFLQEKEYRPVGSDTPVTVDVRIVSATSASLADLVRRQLFRADLRYRLEIVAVQLAPLRERRADILPLARHFLAQWAGRYGRAVREFTPSAEMALRVYEWPGNVRELDNVVHRAVLRARGEGVEVHDLRLDLSSSPSAGMPGTFRDAKARLVREFEREYLCRLLREHGGNVTHAARAAGKDRRAFFALMKKHGIRRDSGTDKLVRPV